MPQTGVQGCINWARVSMCYMNGKAASSTEPTSYKVTAKPEYSFLRMESNRNFFTCSHTSRAFEQRAHLAYTTNRTGKLGPCSKVVSLSATTTPPPAFQQVACATIDVHTAMASVTAVLGMHVPQAADSAVIQSNSAQHQRCCKG